MASPSPPLWGGSEWGAGASTPPPGAGLDIGNSINDVWFRLGFLNIADLAADNQWTGVTELFQFADDAAKRLAFMVGLFVTTDASIVVAPGTAAYPLPSSHVATLLAGLVYEEQPQQLLRLSTIGQLFALDGAPAATAGDPLRASFDAGAVGIVTLYPNPVTASTINQVCEEFPAVSADSSSIPCSPVLQDYFTYALLAAARGKESDNAMPEAASHFKARMDMYEKVMEHLWGPGA